MTSVYVITNLDPFILHICVIQDWLKRTKKLKAFIFDRSLGLANETGLCLATKRGIITRSFMQYVA